MAGAARSSSDAVELPEGAADRLARLLARPIDRRTFLALSALAGPAVLAACATPPTTPRPVASAAPEPTPSGATASPSRVPAPAADWVFVGGPVLTMEPGVRGDGIAVRGEQIVAVGAAADVLELVGEGTRLVDLAGRSVLPGFVDPHQHIGAPVASANGDLSAVEDEALSFGITSRGEAGVGAGEIDAYLAWASATEPRIRTNLYLLHTNNCGEDQGQWYRDHPATTNRRAKLRIAGVKLFTDGGSCGAPAVTFDYPGGIGQGDLYLERDMLAPLLVEWSGAGYQAVVHCLGDRGLDVVQGAMTDAFAGDGNPTRHRIDHNAVVRDDQLARYGELDLVALIFGAFPACLYAGETAQFKYVVPDELKGLEWRWRDLLDAGGHVGWHGDPPIFTLDPLAHVAGFVGRSERGPDGTICEPPAWALPHRVTVDEALRLMTTGAAYALDRDDAVGSLAVGKLADLIVLDRDPSNLGPDELRELSVQLTMVGGVAEFVRPGAEDLAPPPSVAPPAVVTPPPSVDPGLANVALGRPATASQSLSGASPSFAVDGLPKSDDVWNAGGGPPQWIEIDLGTPVAVAAVRLVVAQFPAGPTRHRVRAGAAAGAGELVHEFTGSTTDQDVLTAVFDPPIPGVRFVRVETIESPSDVAWREIEVLSPDG
jgi:predicted amidohydrolase YtcJ